jgi:hypothetical protein
MAGAQRRARETQIVMSSAVEFIFNRKQKPSCLKVKYVSCHGVVVADESQLFAES